MNFTAFPRAQLCHLKVFVLFGFHKNATADPAMPSFGRFAVIADQGTARFVVAVRKELLA